MKATPPEGLSPDDLAEFNRLIEREAALKSLGQPSFDIPLVRTVRTRLGKSDIDTDWGCVRCADPALPYVRCSPEGVGIAVAMLDAALRLATQRDWKWTRAGNDHGLRVAGTLLHISVEEVARRRRHQPTPQELERRKLDRRPSWEVAMDLWRNEPRWDHFPSGEFTIKGNGAALVKVNTGQDVQARIARFPIRALEVAFRRRAKATLDRAREERAKRAAERADRLHRLRELRLSLPSRVDRYLEGWRRARELREFAAALSARVTDGSAAALAAHILRRADEIDPLSDPERIVSREAAILAEIVALEADLAL